MQVRGFSELCMWIKHDTEFCRGSLPSLSCNIVSVSCILPAAGCWWHRPCPPGRPQPLSPCSWEVQLVCWPEDWSASAELRTWSQLQRDTQKTFPAEYWLWNSSRNKILCSPCSKNDIFCSIIVSNILFHIINYMKLVHGTIRGTKDFI